MNNYSVSASAVVSRQSASLRSARTMTVISLLAAIAFILSFFEFPVPLSPSFARMDLSDFPALIGAMTMGPWAGVLVELIKNLLGLPGTGTGGVGELANFLMGSAMVYPAGMIYYKKHRPAWLACLMGAVGMAVMAAVTNYFILLPLFESFMPLDALIESFAEFMPFIQTKLDVVLWNAIPFNLLKGLGIALVTLAVYPKLTPVLRGANKGR